ncbi:hypothetical protein GA0061082_10721 [Snodgrassella sp. R-53583]|nr:hypothetical protein GA0061082_10721 [Snodgrassella sp. R-53583]
MRVSIAILATFALCSCGLNKPPMVSGNHRVPVNKTGVQPEQRPINVFQTTQTKRGKNE